MSDRRQEKIGWIGGWSGGFVWVLISSIVVHARGQVAGAAIGFLIVVLAGLAIAMAAPWRHPRTRYRLLMTPIYLLFVASIGWGLWVWDGPRNMGFASGWSLLVLLPTLMPLWLIGNRRWENSPDEDVRTSA